MFLFFLLHMTCNSLFRLIGSIGRNKVVASTFGGFAMILLFLLSGFVLAKGNARVREGGGRKEGRVMRV